VSDTLGSALDTTRLTSGVDEAGGARVVEAENEYPYVQRNVRA